MPSGPAAGYRPGKESFNPRRGETYEEFLERTGQGRDAPAVAATTGDGTQVDITQTGNDDGTVVRTSEAASYGDPTLQAVDSLIALARERDRKSQAAIEEFIGTSIPKLEALAEKANQGDANALASLQDSYAQFEEMAPPEMVAAARSNPDDVQRQLDAYGMQGDAAAMFKERSRPTMTGQERYLLELNRREEEGSTRAMREAALRDLDARGARSGGAEMGALLGAQQMTSQNRALQDLGAQAQIDARANQNLQGYGNTTAQMANTAQGIRDSGDVMSRFNQQQAQQWAQWEGEYKANQQSEAAGRSRDLFDANTHNNAQTYGRGFDIYGAERDATAMKTDQYSGGAASITKALETGLGIGEARRAEEALKKKERGWGEKILDPADLFDL